MPNGQYHRKHRKSRGVNIKNPLSLPVSVIIKSKTGALRTGTGYQTWRTIKAGGTIYIPLKGTCELDIDIQIIRYNDQGNPVNLGPGAWEHVDHKDSQVQGIRKMPSRGRETVPEHITEEKTKKTPEEVAIPSLGQMIEDLKKEEVKV